MAKKNEEPSIADFSDEGMMSQFTEQMQYLEEYMQKLDKSLIELDTLKESLNELEDVKEGDDIFAPIANGIFVEAKIKSPTTLLVNVGEGVVLRKTIPQTIQLLDKQREEIVNAKEEVEKKLAEIYSMFRM